MDINIEARRSLKICKLQLTAWDSCVGQITVECSASSLSIISHGTDSEDRATFELKFPDCYVFQGGALSPVRNDKTVKRRGAGLEPCREVTFCVPLDRTDAVGEGANGEPVPGARYSFDCAACSAQIVRSAFRRVLPLPSEGWREAAGDWFCHSHGDPKSGAHGVLAPKEDELFTSADRFLVHDSLLQDGVATNAGRLRCSVCQRVLGKKDSASALFTTRVRLASAVSGPQSPVRLSAGNAAYVVSSLIRGQLLINTNCRIILESGGDRRLLLWLMETGLEHCTASGLEPGMSRHVRPEPVIKLLYRETSGQADAVLAGWEEDPLVAVFRLDEEVLADVSALLLSSRLAGASLEPFHVAIVPA